MREFFDDMAGQSPLDPEEAVRRSTRVSQRKRFYTNVGVTELPEGFAVVLDDRPVRTPSRKPLAAPTRGLAEAMAAEWQAQKEFIDPTSMPLTRLGNTVIDGVADRTDAVLDDIAKYFESDLLFYRAGDPDRLVIRQGELWDPVLFWAAETFGAHFVLAEGIVYVAQPPQAVAAARAAMPADAWSAAAMHMVTAITGSALLALALQRGQLNPSAVWAAAHVDEDWNAGIWGYDDEVMARRAARRVDFDAAVTVLEAIGNRGG